ncbi:exodeoxyribonuclease 7 large subunit [Marinithermofilum abyssi]|uniref:Exodeoxyribonuclease 7 large subunit n=1 Tax=Marinithermofilum abyssi TaxID=1571185 RepID=A0A8J2VGX2_9BACL|nr:exodeoxyribonuclease VII large subunit [Marinithermofilum abyssi]GGE10398.1 exodeoxyribonuclease 7 large subunit [Marinithermofilum abyssi]
MSQGREQEIWSITDLVAYLSGVIDQDEGLNTVWVQGEISNFRHHARGHMYFTLKDEHSRMRAVMFAGNNRRLKFLPKDGDDVLVRGRVGVYERDGQVQLYVTQMQPNGIGGLYVAFQQLKERLDEEGLFSPVHKKALPFFPQRVGIITSSSGAAVRDIITTIRRRSPMVDILLHPVPVQGEEAPVAIADALYRMNRQQVDVIIVGRGGGSLEELWAFNEEVVARSIFDSSIPVVSAVGHETDTTISDFVADVRAATPTAAAELVAPRMDELYERLNALRTRLNRAVKLQVDRTRETLRRLRERPVLRKPYVRLEQEEQRLDQLQQQLQQALRIQLVPYRSRLDRSRYRLQSQCPSKKAAALKEQLVQLRKNCQGGMFQTLKEYQTRWLRALDRLEALNPLQVMRRGYSLVYRYHERRLVTSVNQVQPGDLLRIRLKDGQFKCQVWGKEEGRYERNRSE